MGFLHDFEFVSCATNIIHVNNAKLNFLKTEFLDLLAPLESDAIGNWGKMKGQHMVEHFADSVKIASGKLLLPRVNEGERLEKSRSFLLSETPFRENLKNPFIGENVLELRQPSMTAALEKLKNELHYFFSVFETDPTLTTHNPFFGELDYAGNVQFLHKHAMHHLKQFGLVGER